MRSMKENNKITQSNLVSFVDVIMKFDFLK